MRDDIQFIQIDPRTMLDERRASDIVGQLARLIKAKQPGMSIARARDIAMSGVYGALATAREAMQ